MAISLSGTDLVLISATSNTTTTNTTFNANVPNDSNYFLPNSILAGVSTGVTIDGFGLFLWSTLADKNLDMINDGTIAVTQAAVALTLVATGGAVSYLGAGTITSANGPALPWAIATPGPSWRPSATLSRPAPLKRSRWWRRRAPSA